MFENIRLSFQGIWSHKLRSFLTMLGIIIGIAAIIAIVSTIEGTNELIKNGSKLVTKVEDILIEYPQIKFKKKLLKEKEKQVPKELEKVYKCIKNEPANINQIVRKTKMSIQDISYKIMLLQLENLIEELPGQVYRIKNGEDDE